VIDDDDAIRQLVGAIFRAEGCDVRTAPDGAAGLRAVAADPPDVVLLDLHMPGLDGFAVLERLREDAPAVSVVMLTGSMEIKHSVQAMRLGAVDYVTKPMNRDEIVLVVKRALKTRALEHEIQDLRREVGRQANESLAAQMGPSDAVRQVIQQVETVAGSTFTVLITGETGTGKEIVAQAIHRLSDRRHRPLIALDCGAIPETLLESELFGHEKGAFTGAERRKEGRFRLADGGTCFLDEVGNLPASLQAKLLRVLESKEVQALGADRGRPLDVRFVAATNQDLRRPVAQGRFRADLYFRLAQYTIELPPLRARAEDIPHLAQRFLDEASIELRRPVQTIVGPAMDLLSRHDWPGNVRELRNVVRQAVLQTEGVAVRLEAIQAALDRTRPASNAPAADDGPAASSDRSLKQVASEAAEAAERRAICDALRASAGNKSRTARALQTDYKTLHLKMKRFGIRARDFS